MKAIIRDRYGTAEVLRLEEVDRPTPRDDEVLIGVHGSSVNMGDRLLMRGVPYLMRLAIGLLRPRSRGLGQDVSGRVEAVGAKVREWSVGDEVYGEVTGGACWAEYAVAPAAALARSPSTVPLAEAGAVPLAAMTALRAVRDRVQPGQRVLVNGGSGSVGSYAVQIARALGAEVTAVCSGRSAERARQLGATDVVDYTEEDFTEAAEPFDLLLDIAGSRPLSRCLQVLEPDGTLVAIGGPADNRWLDPLPRLLWALVRGWFAKQRVVWAQASTPRRELLDALTGLIEVGDIAPAFDSRCELADLPEAMRDLEAGRRRGKVLVTVH